VGIAIDVVRSVWRPDASIVGDSSDRRIDGSHAIEDPVPQVGLLL